MPSSPYFDTSGSPTPPVGGTDDPGIPDDLLEGLGWLYSGLLDLGGLEEAAGRMANLAVATVPGCDHAEVTFFDDTQPAFSAGSDATAEALARAQDGPWEGPRLAAWRQRRAFEVAVDASEERWPHYVAAARAGGIEMASFHPLLLPTRQDEVCSGVLTVAACDKSLWDDASRQAAEQLAGQLAVALSTALVHRAAVDLAHNLRQALESRSVIEQAKGILMARHRCSPEEAFTLLVKRSQREQRKLHLVAADLVAAP